MENQVSSGMNKTGAQMAPLGTPDIERFARERADGEGETNGSYEQVHQTYMQGADRIGSVPVPATMKGMATTAISAMTGKKPAVFLDKLGERLAYERTGVRLYQALILKCTAAHADTGLAIVGILMDDPAAPARDFIAQYGASWPTVEDPDTLDDDACAHAAGTSSTGRSGVRWRQECGGCTFWAVRHTS